jgi:uncharacterized membrane protein YbaN (DUF454 family)
MRKKLKQGFVLAVGLIFLALGVVGLVLPFLQGVLFIAVGLILLSFVSPRVRTFLDRHTTRYPRIHEVIVKVENWVTRVVGEV